MQTFQFCYVCLKTLLGKIAGDLVKIRFFSISSTPPKTTRCFSILKSLSKGEGFLLFGGIYTKKKMGFKNLWLFVQNKSWDFGVFVKVTMYVQYACKCRCPGSSSPPEFPEKTVKTQRKTPIVTDVESSSPTYKCWMKEKFICDIFRDICSYGVFN